MQGGNREKDPKQSQRFIEAAKKAEADETEEGADRAFKRTISAKAIGKEKAAKAR